MLNSFEMTLISNPLPALYLITPNPRLDTSTNNFIHQLEKSLASGIRLVQLRAKNLHAQRYQALAQQVMTCCKQYDAILLLNADPEVVMDIDADGVHLDGTRLAAYQSRPLDSSKIVSASCHSLEQLAQAEKLNVDFVTLSPVLKTTSHPDALPLGWPQFAQLAKQTSIPVYALGGMHPAMLKHAQENQAYGVAGISGFWDVQL